MLLQKRFEHGWVRHIFVLSTVLIPCSKVAFCQSTVSTEAKIGTRAQKAQIIKL